MRAMGVLAMLELQGETADLLAAMEDVDRLLPESDGLLARIVASTEDGVVLFQLWESADARDRNADDPAHAEALAASGIFAATGHSRARLQQRRAALPPLTVAPVSIASPIPPSMANMVPVTMALSSDAR